MKYLGGATALAVLLALAMPAQAAFLWFENFESGDGAWTRWQERETETDTGIVTEDPDLGTISPESGANDQMALTGGSNQNGGYYRVITGLPTGVDLTIDGYWRHSSTFQTNKDWSELQVIEGDFSTVYNPGDDITGNLEYKQDSWTVSSPSEWDGLISDNADVTNDGVFQTASGTVTVVLKYGNQTGSTHITVAWDDLYITPEPATMALLGLGGLAMLRRRRLA